MNNDIDDPSDYPPSHPHLRTIDTHLRCSICRALFDACMITPCQHLFCSLCVRGYLAEGKKECPTCRASCSQEQLNVFGPINAILDAYKQCRAEIIKAVKRPVSEPVVQSANLDRSRHLKTPRGPEISKVGSSSKTRGRPKKRIDKIEEEGEEVDRAIDVDRDDTLAFSSRLIKATTDRELRSTRGTPANSSRQSDDLHAAHESSDHKTCSDDDFVLEPVSSSRPARGKATLSSRSSGTTMSQNSLLPIEPATPTSRNQQFIPLNSESSQMLSVHPENLDETFKCPICGQFVPYRRLGPHLDAECPRETPLELHKSTLMSRLKPIPTKLKPKSGSFPAMNISPIEPLSEAPATFAPSLPRATSHSEISVNATLPTRTNIPTPAVNAILPYLKDNVVYNLVKEKDLKRILSRHGLPTEGKRHHLERRHKLWIQIFNANLDAGNKKSHKLLLKSLANMERQFVKSHNGSAGSGAGSAGMFVGHRNASEESLKVVQKETESYLESQNDAFLCLIEQVKAKAKDKAKADAEKKLKGEEKIEDFSSIEASRNSMILRGSGIPSGASAQVSQVSESASFSPVLSNFEQDKHTSGKNFPMPDGAVGTAILPVGNDAGLIPIPPTTVEEICWDMAIPAAKSLKPDPLKPLLSPANININGNGNGNLAMDPIDETLKPESSITGPAKHLLDEDDFMDEWIPMKRHRV